MLLLLKKEVISEPNSVPIGSFYSRTTGEFNRGNFRVNSDIIDIFPGADVALNPFFGDEIEEIESFDPMKTNFWKI